MVTLPERSIKSQVFSFGGVNVKLVIIKLSQYLSDLAFPPRIFHTCGLTGEK